MPNIQKKNQKKSPVFDKLIYIIAILAPLMTLPQLYKVWTGNHVQGVSIYTWAAYAAISLIWVIYGARQRMMPIICTNGLLLIVDFLVVLGVLFRN